MATTKKIVLKHCIGCDRDIDIGKFNSSKGIYHNGYLPYCKDCCNKIFKENMARMKTQEGALYVTLTAMDIPFIKEVYDKSVDEYKSRSLNYSFGAYFNKLNNQKLFDWESSYQTDIDYKDIAGLSPMSQNIKADTEKLKLDWGNQTIEDYKYLVYVFKKYSQDVEFENPQHEDLYRDLCSARLDLRKINEGESSGDLQKAQARILSLMNTLKLSDYNTNKPKTLSEQMIFEKIKQIEENNVEDIYKTPRKYADFNKYIEYIKQFSLRPLANMLAGKKDFDINLDDVGRYNFANEEKDYS